MLVRRCLHLFVELDDEPRFSLTGLLSGGEAMEASVQWLAHAPHLPQPRPITLDELAVLQPLGRDALIAREALLAEHGEAVVQGLIDDGLLLPADADGSAAAALDATLRAVPWWPQAALAHRDGGWESVDVQARDEAGLSLNTQQMLTEYGAPPAHEYRRQPEAAPLALPKPLRNEFDALLARRKTCRNFDDTAVVRTRDLATMLHRVWGAMGTLELAPGAVAVKKNSPAGGGMHAVEAYVLVQRAEGLEPGLYHYLALDHALEPLRLMAADDAAKLAHRFVAGQHWFANAPVLVVMAARFDRLFWKYRRHAKAWRVVHLDAGHLSQTMYLAAADLGLGAFVTAAVNDRDIDTALELQPLREGSIAVVGFGPRAATTTTAELDNLQPTPASLA